jgi:hypothetical protein
MNNQVPVSQAQVSQAMEDRTQGDNLPAVPPPKGKLMFRLEVPESKGDLVTNYRPDVEADRVEVSRCMSPSDCRLDVHVGKTIRVVGVLLNMAEFESQDVKGEMMEKVYASIALEDGTIIGTTGKAVMGQLAFLIGASKPGPFDPPVEFEVRRHKSQPPKQDYYSLRRVRPPQRKQGKEGAK